MTQNFFRTGTNIPGKIPGLFQDKKSRTFPGLKTKSSTFQDFPGLSGNTADIQGWNQVGNPVI